MNFFRIRFKTWEGDTAGVTHKRSVSLVVCAPCAYPYQCDQAVRDFTATPVAETWAHGCESPLHEGDRGALKMPEPKAFRRTAIDEVLAWGKEEWQHACRKGNGDIVLALYDLMGDILVERHIIKEHIRA